MYHTLIIYFWALFYKVIWIPTKTVKAKIIFHGFLIITKVRTKDDILSIISKYIEGHSMSNMFGDNNPVTTFSMLCDRKSE